MNIEANTARTISGFISATEYTFATQCNLTVSAKEPAVTEAGLGNVDIAAVMAVDGLDRPLSVALGFTEATYLNIINAMLGESFSSLTDDLTDPISELVNIIFGAAKRDISSRTPVAQKVIPAVFLGKIKEVIPLTNCSVFVIPFDSPRGSFSLQLGVGESFAMG